MSLLIIVPSIMIASEIYYIETGISYPIFLNYFEYSLIILIAIYIIFPVSLLQNYFNLNEEYLVKEYELLKKIMYVGIPFLVIIMLVFIKTYSSENQNFSFPLFSGLILIVTASFLKIIINLSSRNFRYYYAKGCFTILMKRKDESDKIMYFVMGIDSYNKYLKRILKLQINNISTLKSQIISNFVVNNSDFIDLLFKTFQSENKLLPIIQIFNVIDIKIDQFLIHESLWEKIKDWGAFLVAVIPVTISIIQFVLKLGSQ